MFNISCDVSVQWVDDNTDVDVIFEAGYKKKTKSGKK